MFSYFLSVAVTFIVFGTLRNISQKVKPQWYKGLLKNEEDEKLRMSWVLVVIASFAWFVAVPICIVICILYLLKLLTDRITDVIMKSVHKDKDVN